MWLSQFRYNLENACGQILLLFTELHQLVNHCVSKSSTGKKLKFCEWKKGLKMLLAKLLAWRGKYKDLSLYNCKDKSMSLLLILLILEYLVKKTESHL